MKTNDLQLAFVLHYRAYRETSLLVNLLSQHAGRIDVVARGAKRTKCNSSPLSALLQPFVPLMVNWQGRGDLYTLTTAEQADTPLLLHGDALLSGFYLNELLINLLHRGAACNEIFKLYQQTLYSLSQENNLAIALRLFEKKLLQELGYLISLDRDANTNEKISDTKDYLVITNHGCVEVNHQTPTFDKRLVFSGRSLLAIHQNIYSDTQTLLDARRLMRVFFSSLLNGKPIKSRELFL